MDKQALYCLQPCDLEPSAPPCPEHSVPGTLDALSPLSINDTDEEQLEPCLVYTLVGKTGHGKSTTGNTLSGLNSFKASSDFESETKMVELCSYKFERREYCCIDTPGTFDTSLSLSELCSRLAGVTHAAPDGLDAVLVVVKKGRMTEEELRALEVLQTLFGADVWRFAVVVFTHCTDTCGDLKQRIQKLPEKHLLKRACTACGWRIAKVNNECPSERDRERDREELHARIQEVKFQTGEKYDNTAFQYARETLAKVQYPEEVQSSLEAYAQRRCQLKSSLNSGRISLEEYTSQLSELKRVEEELLKDKKEVELASLRRSFERWDSAKDWGVRIGGIAATGAVAAGSIGAVGYVARAAFPYTLPLALMAMVGASRNPESDRRDRRGDTVIRVEVDRDQRTRNNECTVL